MWGKVARLDSTNTVKAAKLPITKKPLLIELLFPQCNACYPGEIFFCFSVDKVLSSSSSVPNVGVIAINPLLAKGSCRVCPYNFQFFISIKAGEGNGSLPVSNNKHGRGMLFIWCSWKE